MPPEYWLSNVLKFCVVEPTTHWWSQNVDADTSGSVLLALHMALPLQGTVTAPVRLNAVFKRASKYCDIILQESYWSRQ